MVNFATKMVEVEHNRIRFATDYARVLAQKRQDMRPFAMATPQHVSRVFDPLVVGRSSLRKWRKHEYLKAKQLAPAKVPRRAFAMAIGADDVAFGDLFGDR
jgi:hypothetical protein